MYRLLIWIARKRIDKIDIFCEILVLFILKSIWFIAGNKFNLPMAIEIIIVENVYQPILS